MNRPNPPDRPSPNSYWVVPGRFAAGEYPGAIYHAEAAAKLKSLLEAGIDHFIDLTEPGELEPYARIAEREAQMIGKEVGYERHSIVDASVPHRPEQMAAILDSVANALDDWQDRIRPLLGRSRPDRHGGRLLAGAARTHWRRSPSPACRVVANRGKGSLASPFTRDAGTV